jgi:hypothetical protein
MDSYIIISLNYNYEEYAYHFLTILYGDGVLTFLTILALLLFELLDLTGEGTSTIGFNYYFFFSTGSTLALGLNILHFT